MKNERPKTAVASTSITTSPPRLVTMLESTSPPRYSEMDSGVAKMFRKLRDHTSSKNAMVTPCITRDEKIPQQHRAQQRGTKLKPRA